MAAHGSKKVIFAALAGNTLISITKFAAAAYTGSAAMLSEGIHSLVDTGNQGLLLLGMKRAEKPADEKHPFGYGSEIYFWAFVVAIMIFAVGAGISLYEGIQKILNPHPIESALIAYIVLGLAIIFEGWAWMVAYKEFKKTKGKRPFLAAVRDSKDPTVFTVLFEDTAAMLGLLVAFAGIYGAQALGIAWLDGAASVLIGLILAGTAFVLALETKGLLIGESASDELVASVREILQAPAAVKGVNEIRTLHLGPNDVLLAASLDFEDALTAGAVEEVIFSLEDTIKRAQPLIGRVFLEVQAARDHQILEGE
ncbi:MULTISPECIES: cation diffusion facilitator family transporter [unclassified Pseudovibrio]|uniref:cation diffusion facilitator family transporter n=1 Tax=unclassified Pseudovibrio TaxID=2627060 RepID=UPI0007AE969A|nr:MULTISPECIES: cation diffusion facilitator family transporter [unclassified Pseudovibrio]KZK98500.1 Ferrous-iron efflux pump FieF [Pseudovibrio sp. W74]KZL08346.1 Ferrous-iron efflux pump FieF [Pseudovibrio sp. Ad14]